MSNFVMKVVLDMRCAGRELRVSRIQAHVTGGCLDGILADADLESWTRWRLERSVPADTEQLGRLAI